MKDIVLRDPRGGSWRVEVATDLRERMRGIETFRSMQHEEIRRHLRRHHDLDLVPRRLIAGRKRERALAGLSRIGIAAHVGGHHHGNFNAGGHRRAEWRQLDRFGCVFFSDSAHFTCS